MKESLPASWAKVRLDEVATIATGRTPPTARREFFGGEIPFAKPPHLLDKSIGETEETITHSAIPFAQVVPANTVLVSCIGKLGKTGLTTTATAFNQQINAVTFGEAVEPRFGFYACQTLRLFLESVASATTIPIVNKTKFSSAKIPLPPLPEQRRIVEALDRQFSRLEAGIEDLRRTQANLKRHRAAVLKAACEGRLVPTEAEIAGAEGKNYESAALLLSRLLEKRARIAPRAKQPKLEDLNSAYFPKLPEGWTWATVNSLSTKVVDGVHKKPTYVESGVPFVTVRNLTAGPTIEFENLKYVSWEDHQEFIKRANPEKGDILISKDGTLGVVRAIRIDKIFSIFVSVALVKPISRDMTDYLEIALSSPQVQAQMVPKGSGLQHIHLEDLREDLIPLPPLEEQRRIVLEVRRRLSVIEAIEQAIRANLARANSLRKATLSSAFRGRLVPQDSKDEPASVLLDRIKQEHVGLSESPFRRRGRRPAADVDKPRSQRAKR